MSLFIKNKIIFLVVLLIADQASKLVALKNLILGQSVSVFPYFDLTLVFNTGVAFSLFSEGGALGRWLLVFLVFFVLIYLAYVLFKESLNDFESLSLLLILSGGMGNLLDRTFRGYVVDFIHLYYENYSFYVFNFADTYITIGVVTYIIGMIYQYKSKGNENQAS
jgi:signal peptidase II